ncbi:hypothetical protein BSU04_39845 [Caballeronia sordidicola]|uniref:Uncharacterized protein n=1 Tax=Caballeronia sordidicola TaxID=196367 RepID=A0A226WNX3_CABSO|nr:hypothetical protein BSU04_39845 [Caballeronia sordidicola]
MLYKFTARATRSSPALGASGVLPGALTEKTILYVAFASGT